MRRFLLTLSKGLALPVFAGLGLAACQTSTPETPVALAAGTASDSTAALDSTALADGTGLVITGITAVPGAKAFSGRVENRSDAPFDSIRVWISVLGPEPARDSLGAVEMTLDSLGAASAWHFTRPYDADSVRVVRVDRYAGTRRGGERTDAVVRALVPLPRL